MPFTQGRLIVIEGIDGAGKSTQARMLYDELCHRGIATVLSREPTDSKYGQKIRELAQDGREAASPEEEYRLFLEDRKIHVNDLILPALKDGKVVILDRYYFSTIAYQSARGLDPEKIRRENEAFCPIPDIVLLMDVPTNTGIHRIKQYRKETPNLFEKKSYLDKVARNLARLDDQFIVRIDGSGSLEDVQRRIMSHVAPILNKTTPLSRVK
jgi:dTMP kinase